jgi:hypothetical protein
MKLRRKIALFRLPAQFGAELRRSRNLLRGATMAPQDDLYEFILRLEGCIEECGLTAFAQAAGASEQEVESWRSRQAVPMLDQVLALQEGGNISADWLITGEGSKPYKPALLSQWGEKDDPEVEDMRLKLLAHDLEELRARLAVG